MFLEAGAKVTTSFISRKKNLKFFFEDLNPHFLYLFFAVFQGTLRILRAANVIS
jgi:hypothetical protein